MTRQIVSKCRVKQVLVEQKHTTEHVIGFWRFNVSDIRGFFPWRYHRLAWQMRDLCVTWNTKMLYEISLKTLSNAKQALSKTTSLSLPVRTNLEREFFRNPMTISTYTSNYLRFTVLKIPTWTSTGWREPALSNKSRDFFCLPLLFFVLVGSVGFIVLLRQIPLRKQIFDVNTRTKSRYYR